MYTYQVIDQVREYLASEAGNLQVAYVGNAPQLSSYEPGLEIADTEGMQAMMTADINEAFDWLGVKTPDNGVQRNDIG